MEEFIMKETLLNKTNWINKAFDDNKEKFEKTLRLNLQHFSEKPEGEETPPSGENNPEGEETPADKTYTQSEVDSQISKAVNSALTKRDKEVEKRIEQERKEAESLAKLTEKEREAAKLDKQAQQLEEREQELLNKELRADAIDNLIEKDLPKEFADFVVSGDSETTLENINAVKSAFDKAVNERVKQSVRQETPGASRQLKNRSSFNVDEFARKSRIIK